MNVLSDDNFTTIKMSVRSGFISRDQINIGLRLKGSDTFCSTNMKLDSTHL